MHPEADSIVHDRIEVHLDNALLSAIYLRGAIQLAPGVHCTPLSAQQVWEMSVATEVLAGIPLGSSSKMYTSRTMVGCHSRLLGTLKARGKLCHNVFRALPRCRDVRSITGNNIAGNVPVSNV
jgi:hypothetical protein